LREKEGQEKKRNAKAGDERHLWQEGVKKKGKREPETVWVFGDRRKSAPRKKKLPKKHVERMGVRTGWINGKVESQSITISNAPSEAALGGNGKGGRKEKNAA